MTRTTLINIISFFFILLFLYTGIEKFMEIHLFKEQLTSSPLLSSMAGLIAWVLPIAEIILAIALFIPRWNLKALYATLVLMTAFTVYVLVILSMDNHLSCSCGGIIEDLSPPQHLIFNSACIILSVVGIVIKKRQQPTTVRFKWLTSTSVLFLFLLVGWTLSTAFSTHGPVKTGMEGRLLPTFNIMLPDSSTYLNTNDIPTGKPILMIGFSPYCRHCQDETRDIIQQINKFKDLRIYLVTPFSLKDTKGFYAYFKLAKYPNITLGIDTNDYFLHYFKASGIPYTTIFDSKKRLKHAIPGAIGAEKLAQMAAE